MGIENVYKYIQYNVNLFIFKAREWMRLCLMYTGKMYNSSNQMYNISAHL